MLQIQRSSIRDWTEAISPSNCLQRKGDSQVGDPVLLVNMTSAQHAFLKLQVSFNHDIYRSVNFLSVLKIVSSSKKSVGRKKLFSVTPHEPQ